MHDDKQLLLWFGTKLNWLKKPFRKGSPSVIPCLVSRASLEINSVFTKRAFLRQWPPLESAFEFTKLDRFKMNIFRRFIVPIAQFRSINNGYDQAIAVMCHTYHYIYTIFFLLSRIVWIKDTKLTRLQMNYSSTREGHYTTLFLKCMKLSIKPIDALKYTTNNQI